MNTGRKNLSLSKFMNELTIVDLSPKFTHSAPPAPLLHIQISSISIHQRANSSSSQDHDQVQVKTHPHQINTTLPKIKNAFLKD
jgi:hypothetical protein